ncbi:MBL fold metallo-hydrolase RNA specificity domain-containing protein [Vibrio sp. B1FLJ16]|uniref:MBL fold metallo-hydrolase RNA specificity domain-containing protein n=1 Tax=Vibrio sp. B1FLJ16 TaxID=2751178 RepID=UPI0015F3FAE4|nr:MBL fold metallo-hydrolase [Vibrio sp. B1FLJ16]CAD7797733.1 exonuclease of the beta-lactamase fold involved in RNA processing [Vibrio sp. B1FLJ16]CAE6881743.1 exonuclease of the beta-lactamase fold involved in RNA processing [Vibrio sp. B1FLJ16]
MTTTLSDIANVIHHGGKDTVTGSCHELKLPQGCILIDCGLFQGQDLSFGGRTASLDIEFPVDHVQALALTHAHIDHIGRLPWLLAAGFKGSIYCTEATAELVPLMLEDGLKLQLGLNYQQRQQILNIIRKQLKPCDYGQWVNLPHLADVRFQPAGHILGSAYVEFKLPSEEIIVFSGDLGPSNTPLLPDPQPPERADYLFIESTYGDKQHEDIATRSTRLNNIIDHALTDGGVILIPAFSVGRTQELLFDIEQLINQRELASSLPIILDSPLANKVTKTYRRFKTLWGQEAKQRLESQRHPLAFDQCITVENHKEHMALVNRLASTDEPAIVVAASGMCEGGRIVNYLKALLPDERNDVLFAGYQAQGTLGAAIQAGRSTVEIDSQQIEVNAQIHTISGYSAHADKNDLLRFVTGIPTPPKAVHLIHGEERAKRELGKELENTGIKVVY